MFFVPYRPLTLLVAKNVARWRHGAHDAPPLFPVSLQSCLTALGRVSKQLKVSTRLTIVENWVVGLLRALPSLLLLGQVSELRPHSYFSLNNASVLACAHHFGGSVWPM